jgi:hypothetical protein
MVSFTPLPLYPQKKSPRYPLDRSLGGPQSRFGRYGGKKDLAPAGNRNPTVQPLAVPVPTDVSRLQHFAIGRTKGKSKHFPVIN